MRFLDNVLEDFIQRAPPAMEAATYAAGRPAADVAPCGKGRVLACGVHPEADPSWYEGLAISPPARGILDLARAMVTEVRR